MSIQSTVLELREMADDLRAGVKVGHVVRPQTEMAQHLRAMSDELDEYATVPVTLLRRILGHLLDHVCRHDDPQAIAADPVAAARAEDYLAVVAEIDRLLGQDSVDS